MPRIITGPGGRKLHLGGRRRPGMAHKFSLHKYNLNLANWPATPASTSYGSAPAAQACLNDVLGNDQLGCCTEADQYHRQALRQAAGDGAVFHPTLDQVIATYSRDGGYVPGQPSTDQGCDETVVMQNATSLGIPEDTSGNLDKPAGFVLIDASNRDLVRAAVSAFVGASICMELPDAWITPFPSAPGWTWDVPPGGFRPNQSNGHCYTLGDQTETGLPCWSWGMPFILTYDALAAGCSSGNGGALYIIVDQEILNAVSKAAPDALDWAQLIADFNDAGGNAPAPSPSPPSTGGPPTLAQAQSWAAAGIQQQGHDLLSSVDAIAAASAGLAAGWPQS